MSSGRLSRLLGMGLALGLAAMALIFVFATAEPYLHDESRGGTPMAILVLILGAAIFAAVLLGPVGKAIGRMLETAPRGEDLSALRIEELEARISSIENRGLTSGEVEAQFSRLAEVEDRLDFAERLLSRVEPTSQERLK